MADLKISWSLAAKLGSAIVHSQEMFGPGGHHLDQAALKSVIEDPEVEDFCKELRKHALLPVKRG